MSLLTDIHVRSFTGSGLKSYLHSMAKLRMEVFKDYPYFVMPHLDREMAYLKLLSSCKEAIGVLIFDNVTLVGVSLGSPFSIQDSALHQPFKERGLNIDSYYYFGNSALLKPYRGRGIGHHFFDAREAHVAQYKKYKHICFCVPTELPQKKPIDYGSLDDFWRKRGYHYHPEMKCTLLWEDIDHHQPREKTVNFWVKNLNLS